ncbi:MAG: 30S ribosomal protein S20 [Candidatus Hydrogenedentes bacterium]|nr:30S ribosomal protein S20 [Candidatus Hydrogenedentota bacterium]
MANIKSAKKRIRTNELRRQRNLAVNSRMKTFVKSAMAALASKDPAQVAKAIPAALSEIDRAASKGVIHPKSASRKKSSLQRRAAQLAN